MKTSFFRSVTLFAMVAIVGAGCPTNPPVSTPPTGTNKPVQSSRGFGTLPSLALNAPIGAPTPPSGAVENTQTTTDQRVGMMNAAPSVGTGIATPGKVIAGRPIPIPPPNPKPATVVYQIETTVPTWGTEDNVLRYAAPSYPNSSLLSFADVSGLPRQALGDSPTIQSFNASWKDVAGFVWNFDAASRSVSAWKQSTVNEVPQNVNGKNPPTIDAKTTIAVADAFLASHGFSSLEHAPGSIEEPWATGRMMNAGGATTDIAYPCPVYEGGGPVMMAPSAVSGGGGSGSSAGSAGVVSGGVARVNSATAVAVPPSMPIKPGIYPCWYGNQVTVSYDGMRGGRKIADLSGTPFRAFSVTVDLTSNSVTGFSGWLDRPVDSSSYPLLDAATVTKRLMAGGRNPIWPWEQGGDIVVHLKSVEVVWMRYDVYTNDASETYLIPAIAAHGTVDYSKDNSQTYNTLVPLVTDDAFDTGGSPGPTPVPYPMMKGAAGGTATPPSPETAPTPVPTKY